MCKLRGEQKISVMKNENISKALHDMSSLGNDPEKHIFGY